MRSWEELKEACRECTLCELSQGRNQSVFGVGNEESPVLFVGEGPGEQEDLKGEPFVGRAGKLLDDMMGAIGIKRDMVYIANVVKCRPPKNRDPRPDEMERCIEYLRNQVFLMRPRIIVCLGRIAAYKLIAPDFKITKEHGVWFDRKGVHMMATFHPAALLRDPSRKVDALSDFRSLEAMIQEHCPGFYSD